MKKHIKNMILFAFLFSGFFVFATNANVVSTNSVVVREVASNVSVAQANITGEWYRTKTGLWYYFENNRSTTKTGWFVDWRDGQTYYFRPENGIMEVGWKNIDGEEYYFNENKTDESSWAEIGIGFYEKVGNGQRSYGALYVDCMTPDGKMVDKNGRLIK